MESLAEKARSIIDAVTPYIKAAKVAANELLSQFRVGSRPNAYHIPPRQEKTANVFPFYIGRLNPPHLYHLLSLFTAIFIARQHGTKALFILGSGRAKAKRFSDPDPKIENPLPDELKWEFITNKLNEFDFVRDIDYEIVKLRYPNSQLAEFIVREVGSKPVQDLTIVQIGGDKPEPISKGRLVLDVDKFLDYNGLFILPDLPATYKQAVIESGESLIRVIDNKGHPIEGVMSASLLRKTACNCLILNKLDKDKAFRIWAQLFTPMYKNDKLSRDVFDTIRLVTCHAAVPWRGGSQRKHTIRKLCNKKTFQMSRGSHCTRRRCLHLVSRNKTKRRK
jgi:hypothetical protein